MGNGKKNIIVFMALMAIAAGIYLWYYPLNKGTLNITVNLSNYFVFYEGISTECLQNRCEIKLKPGSQKIKIQQDGYFPETIEVTIKRGKNAEIQNTLKKVPKLIISEIVPNLENKEKAIPKEFEAEKALTFSWNKNSDQFAFIDKTDSKLKTWKNGEIKTITPLKDASENMTLYWSENNQDIFGQEGNVIYFINTEKASRKKSIIDFNPKNITWIPGKNDLLVNDENMNVYRISLETEKEEKMELNLNLKNTAWEKENRLIFYDDKREENRTLIVGINMETLEKTEILTKFNFPIDQITSDKEKIFFHHESQDIWYELDY